MNRNKTIRMKLLMLPRFSWLEILMVVLIIVLLFTLIMWMTRPTMSIDYKIRSTQWKVGLGREEIAMFRKIQGRYPNSLDELEGYSGNNIKAGFRGILFEEFCSDQRGNSNEYNALNGEGGWYYNKNTGELRVNLTKPIKLYLENYSGTFANEIPSEW